MLFFNSKKRARQAVNVRNKPAGAARRGAGWRMPRRAAAAMVFFTAAATMAAGVWAHHHYYLRRDGRYTLLDLDIGPGVLYTPAKVAEILGLEEGKNIFEVCDIAEGRKHLLQTGHAVKEVSITRVLPGRLVVRTVEREPVARIAGKQNLLVDGEGVVFEGNWPAQLPVITGTGNAGAGARLQGMGLESAFFARVLRSAGTSLPVASIDASQVDYLVLTLTGGRRVEIAWEGMGRGDAEKALLSHLDSVAGIVETVPAGRSFDARKKNEISARE